MHDAASTRRVTACRRVRAGDRTRGLLRFLTCGSVDDGKSTLIGRLLFDCRLLYEDQLAALTPIRRGSAPPRPANSIFALLVDGLEAEREQGITIDVAYRYFSTGRRSFIVADAPGHEQYTRNMATAASTAELAVLLVDARKGLLTQTLRHSYIVVADGHPPRRAGGQQDGCRRLGSRAFSTTSPPPTASLPPTSASPT